MQFQTGILQLFHSETLYSLLGSANLHGQVLRNFDGLDPKSYHQKVSRIFRCLHPKHSEPDDDDDWLQALIFIKSCGEDFKEIAHAFSKKSSKYNEKEFEEKWRVLLPETHLQTSLKTFLVWRQRDCLYVDLYQFSSHHSCTIFSFLRRFNNCNVKDESIVEEMIDFLQKCLAKKVIGTSRILFKI